MSVLSSIEPIADSAGPLWTADQRSPDRYCTRLNMDQIIEVRTALNHAAEESSDANAALPRDAVRAQFPLPTVQRLLRDAATQVARGRGFAVISGFPVNNLTDRDTVLLFRGLAAYLAPLARHNSQGRVVQQQWYPSTRMPGNRRQSDNYRPIRPQDNSHFSTAGADAALTLCRHTATFGGMNRFASAATVHNALLNNAADTVTRLYEPLPFVQYADVAAGHPRTFRSPVFSVHRGLFSTRFSRHLLLRAQQVTGEPLPDAVVAVFDKIDELAHQHSVAVKLRAGDLLIVSSHTVLQSRTLSTAPSGFADHAALLHGWMTLPDYAGRRAGAVEEALRGGWVSDEVLGRYGTDWR